MCSGSARSSPFRCALRSPRLLPARVALELTSRISTPHHDWSQTRAFAVPSDTAGLVRLNLRGRERDGILDDRQAEEVLEELEAGLATFELPSGEPVVRFTRRVHDAFGPGGKVSMLPGPRRRLVGHAAEAR